MRAARLWRSVKTRASYYAGGVSLGLASVTGRSFRDWYAGYVDKGVDTADRTWLGETESTVGPMQVEFLRVHGLLPNHSLLDFGCGNLRGGIPLIRYLDPDRYVGVDISRARLKVGEERIAAAGLQSKRPTLLCPAHMSMTELTGRRFDYIWSMSVLCHMPMDDIQELFDSVGRYMHSATVFFATYSDGDARDYRATLKDWFHRYSTLAAAARSHGMNCDPIDEWRHPDERNPRDRMLRLTLLDGTQT